MFVWKVVFEEHVLNEAIYKISWFFTESPYFLQSKLQSLEATRLVIYQNTSVASVKIQLEVLLN